jgi:hypothetical protein
VSLESFKAVHCCDDKVDGRERGERDKHDEWQLNDAGKRTSKEEWRPRKRGVRVERAHWTSSAKIDKLCKILESIREKDPSEKVIVFSQVSYADGVTNEVHRVPRYHSGGSGVKKFPVRAGIFILISSTLISV